MLPVLVVVSQQRSLAGAILPARQVIDAITVQSVPLLESLVASCPTRCQSVKRQMPRTLQGRRAVPSNRDLPFDVPLPSVSCVPLSLALAGIRRAEKDVLVSALRCESATRSLRFEERQLADYDKKLRHGASMA